MKIKNPWLMKLAGWLAGCVFRMLSRTLRFHGHIEAPDTDPSIHTADSYIYSVWHDSILIPLARKALSTINIAALVSRHNDGTHLAAFMKHIGVRSIHGSTNHGGDQAIRVLMREADAAHVFITPDGPRGPHHEAKSGIVYLASRTGKPIIPIVCIFENAWHIRGSWTGLWIPKPFSRCWYLLGEPLFIATEIGRDEVERHRLRLQSEIVRLEQKLDRIFHGTEPAATYRRAA